MIETDHDPSYRSKNERKAVDIPAASLRCVLNKRSPIDNDKE